MDSLKFFSFSSLLWTNLLLVTGINETSIIVVYIISSILTTWLSIRD